MISPLPLPDRVKEWLRKDRQLNDISIANFGLGYIELHGHEWLTIPVGDIDNKLAFYKLKALPWSNAKNKGMVEPKGSDATLYGSPILKIAGLKQVVICEGEPDAMVLNQANIPAVTSTAGAQSFHESWLEWFPPEIEVVLCFDNDDAGRQGRAKVQNMITELRPDLRISDVIFNQENPQGYDITDFSIDVSARGGNFAEEFKALIVPHAVAVKRERIIAQLKQPGLGPVEIDQWRRGIESNFPDLRRAAETCLSVVCQLLIHEITNPFALVLIDAPSSGKTIVIDMFDGINGVTYSTDAFSPSAFVTHVAGRTKQQLEKIDLLPRIRHKALLIREMAVMMSDNDDALRQRLGQLTRVLDGDGYMTESGVHGQRGYKGDYMFTILAASTPFPRRVWELMSGLGHRLFFLGLHTPEKKASELMMHIGDGGGASFKEKQKYCRALTEDRIKTIWSMNPRGIDWDYAKDDMETKMIITELALFLRRFRGEIKAYTERDDDGKEITGTRPEIEDPSRINICLYNLARGHAVACGRNYVQWEDIDCVLTVALDTAPHPRPALLKALLCSAGSLTIKEVEKAIEMGTQNAKKEMFKFVKLGLCDGTIEKEKDYTELVSQMPFGDDEDDDVEVYKEVGQPKNTIKLKKEFLWMQDVKVLEILERLSIIT